MMSVLPVRAEAAGPWVARCRRRHDRRQPLVTRSRMSVTGSEPASEQQRWSFVVPAGASVGRPAAAADDAGGGSDDDDDSN